MKYLAEIIGIDEANNTKHLIVTMDKNDYICIEVDLKSYQCNITELENGVMFCSLNNYDGCCPSYIANINDDISLESCSNSLMYLKLKNVKIEIKTSSILDVISRFKKIINIENKKPCTIKQTNSSVKVAKEILEKRTK